MRRPSNQQIRQALGNRAITGAPAEMLTEKVSAAFGRIDARGGIEAVSAGIAAKIEASRKRLVST